MKKYKIEQIAVVDTPEDCFMMFRLTSNDERLFVWYSSFKDTLEVLGYSEAVRKLFSEADIEDGLRKDIDFLNKKYGRGENL